MSVTRVMATCVAVVAVTLTVVPIVLLLLLVSPAQSHLTDSRIHGMRHVAQQQYGEVCDVGTLNVPIVRSDLRGTKHVAEFERGPAVVGQPFTGCKIHIERTWRPTTEYLCRVVAGHEFGHAAGLAHTPEDPTNIMYPGRLASWFPCARNMTR